jgi:non-specific serine/threonine protein kinase
MPAPPPQVVTASTRLREGFRRATLTLGVAALVIGTLALVLVERSRQKVDENGGSSITAATAAGETQVDLVLPSFSPEDARRLAEPATAPAATRPPVKAPAEASAATATAALTPMGNVRIAVKPWAQILVDGANKGSSPPLKRLSLPVGRHTLQFVNPAYVTHSIDIEIFKDRPIVVSHEFK